MKIKLDENLPTRLASLLVSMGHQVDSVVDEGLTGKPDSDVWIAAQKEGRFLVTQDLDFSDTRHTARHSSGPAVGSIARTGCECVAPACRQSIPG